MFCRHQVLTPFVTGVVGGLIFAMAGGVVEAQLIAADSFNAEDYDPFGFGTDEIRLTGAAGDGNPVVTPGWVDDGDGNPSPWLAGTGNVQWDAGSPGNVTLANSVVGYDDDSTGKGRFLAVSAPAPVTDFRRAFRVMDDYAPADTYYMSALLNPGSTFTSETSKREHLLVGFTSSGWSEAGMTNGTLDEGTPYGLAFGFHGEDADSNPATAGQVDLVIRARQSGGSGSSFPLQDTVLIAGTPEENLENETFLLMLKLEINSGENGEDKVTYWVNPGDVSSEAAATSSTQTTGSFDTFAMDQNDRIDRMLVLMSSYESRTTFFDEMRFATTFEALRGELPVSGLVGDYNNDGVVDAADYTVWRDNLGGDPVALLNRDPANAGDVSNDDYASWRSNYGAVPMATVAGAAAPEPAGLVMAATALLVACGHRRSRFG